MTLAIKIAHASPGYPGRAVVSVRGHDGAQMARYVVEDGQSINDYVCAGRFIQVCEDGHLEADLDAVSQHAYEVFQKAMAQHDRCGTLPWNMLTQNAKDGWRAVAKEFV